MSRIVGSLAALIVGGISVVLVHAGPPSAVHAAVHRIATIALHWSSPGTSSWQPASCPAIEVRGPRCTSAGLWPGWTERALAADDPQPDASALRGPG